MGLRADAEYSVLSNGSAKTFNAWVDSTLADFGFNTGFDASSLHYTLPPVSADLLKPFNTAQIPEAQASGQSGIIPWFKRILGVDTRPGQLGGLLDADGQVQWTKVAVFALVASVGIYGLKSVGVLKR